MSADPDCIVIGAGVVGCSLAFALANQKRSVVLVERDLSEPDRIVGELMQPGGIHALRRLGLSECLDGIDAIVNYGYGVFHEDQSVHLRYPKQPGSDDLEWGRSFHYGRFVMKLRAACLSHPNIKVIEAAANELVVDEKEDRVLGVQCTKKNADGKAAEALELRAPLTFMVDGCFSKFRKAIEHNEVRVRSHFVGAILHDCPLLLPNHGHVVLAKPSPVLLYQIGTHETRVLVDVPGKLPSASTGALKEYMLEFVMPQLPEQIQPSFKTAISEQRLRVMPSSILSAVLNNRKGLIVVGDALNMRHPLTGGGMTVGLWDVVTLSELLHPDNVPSLDQSDLILTQLSRFHWRRKNHSSVINILAQALYEIFSAGDNFDLKVMREACFEYFRLGGVCSEHPVGLLSGLIQKPMILFGHFFAVAFLGVFRLLFVPNYIVKRFVLPPDNFMDDLKTSAGTGGILSQLLYGLMTVYWFLMAAIGVILTLPVNVFLGLRIIVTACVIILPLIWAEMRV